jgi:S-adenosylmethionine-diacylglycerol 3-amino-3-carboxypropyl transferase
MATSFFREIIYSSSNEDSESERRALSLNSEDVVLCISGSGARSLDLLMDVPQKIVSIDFNPTQNFLLELKIAAFKVCKYDEMTCFLGIKTSTDRLQMYERLKPHLSKAAIEFWNNNQTYIANGVLYCGKWERILKSLLGFSSFRKETINKMLNANSLEEQKEIYNKNWDNFIWKFFLKSISNRFLWVYIIREPGAKLIPKTFDVYSYMKGRLDYLANTYLLKENHYANLLFNGKYIESCILPHHLREENFELIKNNVDKIEIVTGSLVEYLTEHKNQITAFSLSDFSSYASEEFYGHIWQNVIDAAADNAKFCERFFLVKKNPQEHFAELKRNHLLEEKLYKEDETAIYTFCVGKIKKHVSNGH